MSSPHPRRWVILVAVLVAAALSVGSAQAASVRISKGEAKSVLRTLHPDEFQASIRPIQNFDGRHYCALDWHVALMTFLDGGDASFTMTDAEASLGPISVTFALDGATIATERTKIKDYADPSRFGFVEAFYFQQGRIFSPEDLSVGAHTLGVSVIDPIGGDFVSSITFYIDPAGSGACL
jgi:hypothetical protein